jgi:nucleotide-binding universal stress UspA family protein
MYHSILVPLDGSAFGEQALPLALSIARRAQVPLQVAHVHVPLAPEYGEPRLGFDGTDDPRLHAQETAYLTDVVKRLTAIGKVPVTSVRLEGSVAEMLPAHAIATGADLIVMTTHGRGPISRFWLGSVADQLIRRSPIPLLLVRPREEAPDFTKEPTLPHLLIPLDGSPLAEQIIEPALDLGTVMRADYTLLRVVEPLMLVGPDPLGAVYVQETEAEQKHRQDEAYVYLDRVAHKLRERSVKVHTRIVASSHTAAAILETAREQVMSLIALRTHGRGGLARFFLGSVADKVIRGSALPVLVCRPSNAS